MSKFKLSDKELKALLENEGLDEPSLSFNRNILNQINAYEHAKSIKTPFALKVLFAVLMAIPLVLIFTNGGIDIGLNLLAEKTNFDLLNASLDFNIDVYYIYFITILVGVIWLGILLNNKLANPRNESKS